MPSISAPWKYSLCFGPGTFEIVRLVKVDLSGSVLSFLGIIIIASIPTELMMRLTDAGRRLKSSLAERIASRMLNRRFFASATSVAIAAWMPATELPIVCPSSFGSATGMVASSGAFGMWSTLAR